MSLPFPTDIFNITYTARGTTYDLNGSGTGHQIEYLGDQGFGLAPLHRITTRGPLQHGDSDIDFRLDPRILQLPLLIKNTSNFPMYQHYVLRRHILNIFRPADLGVINVLASDNLQSINRYINVRVLGGMSFDVDPTDYHLRTVVQLRADDPTWYDSSEVTSHTVTQAMFGNSYPVLNTGNWLSFPQIQATGPVTNLTITNTTTSQVLNVPGTISAGTSYYFDLRYGYKTIYTGPNQTGTNVISAISATSNLATWAINAGSNTISVTGTGLTAASQVVFTWQNRYTGI